ncbi:MAG: tetratricopeptide repeat protein [Bacteroidales bacterium]|nr:tetratricopeptide repeat protein [Bacteroidales bacterium]
MIKSGFIVKIIKHLLLLFFLTTSNNLFAQIDSSFLSKGKFNEEDYWNKLRVNLYTDSSYNASYDFQYYINSGLKKIRSKEYSQAIIDFRSSLSILNNTKIQQIDTAIKKIPSPNLYIGICKSLINEKDSTVYYYKKCISSNKSAIEANNELGSILLKDGKIDSALTYFNQSYKLDMKSITTNYNIGYSYFLANDFAKSKKFLKQSIDINPKFKLSYIILGQISLIENKLLIAKNYFKSAIDVDASSTIGYYYRGFTYLRENELDLAYMDFLKVVELDSANYEPLGILGLIDIKSNRMEIGIFRLAKCVSNQAKKSSRMYFDDFKDIEFGSLLLELNKGNLKVEEKQIGYEFLKNLADNNGYKNTYITKDFFEKHNESQFAKRLYLLGLAKVNFLFTLEFCDQYLQKDSTLTMVQYIKSKILYYSQNYKKSIESFCKVIKNSDLYTSAYYFRGLAYKDYGNVEFAIQDFSKIISTYPYDTEALEARAGSLTILNRDKEAIKDYLKVIRIQPNISVYNNISVLYRRLALIDSAIYYSSKAIELFSNSSTLYFNRGLAYKESKEFDKALSDINKSLEFNPNWLPALFSRSEIFMEIFKYKEAISDLDVCIKANPDEIEKLYSKRAQAYYYIGEYDDAISDFQWLLNINKNDLNLNISMGDCYRSKKDFPNAIKYYDIALKKDSTLSDVYYQKGLCFSSTGESEQAIFNYKKAINIDSTYSLPFSSLAREYYKTGNYNKSIMFSQKAVELNKRDLDAMFIIALSNLRLNNFNVAKRQYQLFKKLGIKQGKEINQKTINDLKELIEKGIYVDESKEILKDIFDIQI